MTIFMEQLRRNGNYAEIHSGKEFEKLFIMFLYW